MNTTLDWIKATLAGAAITAAITAAIFWKVSAAIGWML